MVFLANDSPRSPVTADLPAPTPSSPVPGSVPGRAKSRADWDRPSTSVSSKRLHFGKRANGHTHNVLQSDQVRIEEHVVCCRPAEKGSHGLHTGGEEKEPQQVSGNFLKDAHLNPVTIREPAPSTSTQPSKR